ncbi:hypothetical protein T484DRAFT_2316175 [Baffinella frigidus]|nr:hypothetical protein T484DRAFT_2316175 [Cryptophyta sp. CCMP2293]
MRSTRFALSHTRSLALARSLALSRSLSLSLSRSLSLALSLSRALSLSYIQPSERCSHRSGVNGGGENASFEGGVLGFEGGVLGVLNGDVNPCKTPRVSQNTTRWTFFFFFITLDTGPR